MKKIIMILFLLLFTGNAYAATYYMATGGNDSTGDGSTNNEWLTFQHSLGELVKGDTLIIRDGTYTGESNVLNSNNHPPLGTAWTAGNYTTIKAENDGAVIFDGEDVRGLFYLDKDGANAYWQFEGLLWANSTGNCVQVIQVNQLKFIDCGAYDAADGNTVNFYLRDSDYVLYEGCYAYGGGRYKFNIYDTSQYVILRNCVGRSDHVNSGDPPGPIGVFVNYQSSNVYFQNCIAIDSDQDGAWVGSKYSTFYAVHNAGTTANTYMDQCVSLNNRLAFIQIDGGTDLWQMDDCVGWACYKNTSSGTNNYLRGNNTVINHCTIGVSIVQAQYNYHIYNDNTASVNNTILMNMTEGYAMRGVGTRDYNCYYGNTRNNYNGEGANSLEATNPSTNSLFYIVRIESGSDLAGAGSTGDMGANALILVGTAGTLYGDAGWNTDTANNMWPFPNEDLIRTKMRAYNDNGISGDRGFCSAGETLTSYIWEFLGNVIPDDIYGAGEDTTAPAATSDISAATGSNAGDIDLSWTAPGDDNVTGTATTYDIRYSTSNITAGTWATDDLATGEPSPSIAGTAETLTVSGLNPGETYYFAIKTSDEVPNESGLSNITNAVAAVNPPILSGVSLSGVSLTGCSVQ